MTDGTPGSSHRGRTATVPAQRPAGRRGAEARVLAEAIRRTDLAVALVDLATLRIVAANDPAAALVRAAVADLTGRPVTDYVAGEPTGGIPLLATGRLDGFEAPRRLRCSDGSEVAAYVWVH